MSVEFFDPVLQISSSIWVTVIFRVVGVLTIVVVTAFLISAVVVVASDVCTVVIDLYRNVTHSIVELAHLIDPPVDVVDHTNLAKQ
mgnify:CR=1 FL=1